MGQVTLSVQTLISEPGSLRFFSSCAHAMAAFSKHRPKCSGHRPASLCRDRVKVQGETSVPGRRPASLCRDRVNVQGETSVRLSSGEVDPWRQASSCMVFSCVIWLHGSSPSQLHRRVIGERSCNCKIKKRPNRKEIRIRFVVENCKHELGSMKFVLLWSPGISKEMVHGVTVAGSICSCLKHLFLTCTKGIFLPSAAIGLLRLRACQVS